MLIKSVATIADVLVSSTAKFGEAIATLCFPMCPRMYVLGPFGDSDKGGCIASNISLAAAISMGRRHIHPTVYSLWDGGVIVVIVNDVPRTLLKGKSNGL